MGLKPVLATRPLLVRLFKEWLLPGVTVVDDNQVDISADSRPHIAMLSLPHLFRTTRHNVPAAMPCLLLLGPPRTDLPELLEPLLPSLREDLELHCLHW